MRTVKQEIKNRYLIEEREYYKSSLNKESKSVIAGIIEVTNLNTNNKRHKEWKRYADGYDDREYVINMLMNIVEEDVNYSASVSNIFQAISHNFEDMKKSLESNGAQDLIPLFREYTDEILKILVADKENT